MSHTYTEKEVNEMLGEQAEKHDTEMKNVEINNRLERISSSVKSIETKVGKLIEDEEKEKTDILLAIETHGEERRECEKKVNSRIDDSQSYNHKTFVKKTDLRLYAVIIIFSVTVTTGFITWIGLQNEKEITNISANKIAKKIMKKMELR